MDIARINEVLAKSPAEKARLAVDVEDKRRVWQDAKDTLKMKEAKLYLETKAINSGMTQGDLKATVEADEDIRAERLKVIVAESEYKKKMIDLNKIEDEFVAARKAASIEMSLTRMGG